jgi:hypothetical protein
MGRFRIGTHTLARFVVSVCSAYYSRCTSYTALAVFWAADVECPFRCFSPFGFSPFGFSEVLSYEGHASTAQR